MQEKIKEIEYFDNIYPQLSNEKREELENDIKYKSI